MSDSPGDSVSAANGQAASPAGSDPDVAKKIAGLRSQVRESFGKIVMTMMVLQRYRHQSLADLTSLVLEPLMQDRIVMARSTAPDTPDPDTAGVAIWASVSEEVDQKIREQIKTGTWPVKLKAEDWTSGDIAWLFDVLAADTRTTGAVIANFQQVTEGRELRIHPIIGRLVSPEMLEKMKKAS